MLRPEETESGITSRSNKGFPLSFRSGLVLFFAAVAFSAIAHSQSAAGVSGVGCPAINVSSLQRSVEFYTEVLGFSDVSRQETAGDAFEHLVGVFSARVQIAHMTLGDECLDLLEYVTPRGKPIPPGTASNDLSFQHLAIVVSDMPKAYALLRAHHVESVSSEPQTLPKSNQAAAGIEAFYFKDNDGHILELISFPADKGDAKWHSASSRLFLGIDHTAIVVFDTDRSLAFYREFLGFRVIGTSDNFGLEQDHLSGIFGAHLRITSLRANQGPGIELLEYLTPGNGKPISAETGASDLIHWHIPLVVPDISKAERALNGKHGVMVSCKTVNLQSAGLGSGSAMLIKDPDGHELELIQP